MSNILKVGTQIPGYENNIKNNPYTTADTNIANKVDPSKIVRPDGRSDAGQQEQSATLKFNYESNFGSFIQMMKEVPQLNQTLTELIFSGMSNLVEAGIGEDFAKDIVKFFGQMKMSETELVSFVKSQLQGSVKYKGAFFNLLRQIMNETESVDLKTGILDFVKKYNDMASGKHLLETIHTNLEDIQKCMYRADGKQLETLIAKLIPQEETTDSAVNVQVLKGEIIPMLSKYITKTHDMGTVRNLINLLTFQTSRYENGNLDSLMQSFRRLMNYPAFGKRFQGLNEENLMEVLKNTDFEKAAGKNEWADTFVKIIQHGVKGEAGLEHKQMFENIMNAVLLNESVYMPILHLMLPIELNGHLLFSEMWIDPEAEGSGQNPGERKTKLLIKFDIKDVGFFDVLLLYGQDKMDMQLYYPEKLKDFEKTIQEGLIKIMANNQITFQSLSLGVNTGTKSLSEIFPQIYERKNAINVKI